MSTTKQPKREDQRAIAAATDIHDALVNLCAAVRELDAPFAMRDAVDQLDDKLTRLCRARLTRGAFIASGHGHPDDE
jgi:hypothetical protein